MSLRSPPTFLFPFATGELFSPKIRATRPLQLQDAYFIYSYVDDFSSLTFRILKKAQRSSKLFIIYSSEPIQAVDSRYYMVYFDTISMGNHTISPWHLSSIAPVQYNVRSYMNYISESNLIFCTIKWVCQKNHLRNCIFAFAQLGSIKTYITAFWVI